MARVRLLRRLRYPRRRKLTPVAVTGFIQAASLSKTIFRASATGVAPLQGASQAQVTAKDNLIGTVPLASKLAGMLQMKAPSPIVVALKAAGYVFSKGRMIVNNFALALASKTEIQAQEAASAPTGVAALSTKTMAQATSRLQPNLKWAATATATAIAAGRSSFTLALALSSKLASLTKVLAGPSGLVSLQGRTLGQATGRFTIPTLEALLLVRVTTMATARAATTAFKLALTGSGGVQAKIVPKIAGATALAGKVGTQVKALAAVGFGTIITLAAICATQVKTKVGLIGSTALSSRPVVMVRSTPSLTGVAAMRARSAVISSISFVSITGQAAMVAVSKVIATARLPIGSLKLALSAATKIQTVDFKSQTRGIVSLLAKGTAQVHGALRQTIGKVTRLWTYIVRF